MRRKKHLTERLNEIKDYLVVVDSELKNVNEAINDKRLIDYVSIFNNENEVELEIGCGKGGFITALSKAKPNVNYIAVEMLENIILLACENAKKQNIKNVKFMNTGAEYLARYIKEKSISNIYLNFSPPYPRTPYENRRLTNDRFIKIYDLILKENGSIYQKTDDKVFFEYSKHKFAENGYTVIDLTDKLKNQEVFNIQTEYEKKFVDLGLDIFYLQAKNNK